MKHPVKYIAVLFFGLIFFSAASVSARTSAGEQAPNGVLQIAKEGSFFVGGRDIRSDEISSSPKFASSGTITVDQVYVRYQVPVRSNDALPITLIHGCCLTGKSWETTPDGRMGWDEYFVRKGAPVYVIDQAWRGRSAASPTAFNEVKSGKSDPVSLPALVSAGRETAWTLFRFGPKYNVPFGGVQFPMNALTEFWKQMVPDFAYSLPSPNPTVPGLSELAKKLGGTVLVSHSQSGIYPFQAAALSPEGIAGIIALEPGACPAADSDMKSLHGIPVLIVFGDYVSQSPLWSQRLAGCRNFVDAAKKAKINAKILVLPEVGIYGNTHMLMQDKNNLVVADLLWKWMEANVFKTHAGSAG